MVVKLETKSEIRILIQELKSRAYQPANLPILGALRSALRDQVHLEIFTDEWPKMSSLFIRVDTSKALIPVPSFLKGFMFVYSNNSTSLWKLLTRHGIIDWTEPGFYFGVSQEVEKVILEVMKSHGANWKIEGRGYVMTWSLNQEKLKQRLKNPLPKGWSVGPIRKDVVPLVNATWAHGQTPETEEYVDYLVSYFPSFCVYDEHGNPQSWYVTTVDGCIGIAYTMPDARRRGLLQHLTISQASYANQMKEKWHAYVIDTNEVSLKVNEHYKTDRHPDKVVWIKYAPEVQSKL